MAMSPFPCFEEEIDRYRSNATLKRMLEVVEMLRTADLFSQKIRFQRFYFLSRMHTVDFVG
jgi:hypothetical protein